MKMTIALILSLGILTGFISNHTIVQKNDLEDIKELADKNNIEIASWMALSRDKLGQATHLNDMKNKVEDFMRNHHSYSWKVVLEEKNSHYVWHGKKENTYGITESLKVKAYKSNGKYEIAITKEAKGNKLSETQIEWVSEKFKDSKTFYTVSGVMEASDIKLDKVAAKIIDDAQAKTVELLQEKSFVSISAYTNIIESELKTAKQEKMNLQVGLRADIENNEIDVTIGTPIITTEY